MAKRWDIYPCCVTTPLTQSTTPDALLFFLTRMHLLCIYEYTYIYTISRQPFDYWKRYSTYPSLVSSIANYRAVDRSLFTPFCVPLVYRDLALFCSLFLSPSLDTLPLVFSLLHFHGLIDLQRNISSFFLLTFWRFTPAVVRKRHSP